MDDQTEIVKLLKAYQSKSMTVDQARHSLSEMGYSEDAIAKGLVATGYAIKEYWDPSQLPASDSPEWTNVGNDMLTEKRSWRRTLAWPFIILLGGGLGWRCYVLFWHNRIVFSQNCQQQNPFRRLQDSMHDSSSSSVVSTCYQHAVNQGELIAAAAVGVVVAVVIAKLCYAVADRRRKED